MEHSVFLNSRLSISENDAERRQVVRVGRYIYTFPVCGDGQPFD